MDNEERNKKIKFLKEKLNNIVGNKVKDKIKRDKIRREIKELKMLMTTEDFEELMRASEINTSKC